MEVLLKFRVQLDIIVLIMGHLIIPLLFVHLDIIVLWDLLITLFVLMVLYVLLEPLVQVVIIAVDLQLIILLQYALGIISAQQEAPHITDV